MPAEHYSKLWLSYSSIEDFLQCPRAYFLKNMYKDPATGLKVCLMQPALALGQVVHAVIESQASLKAEQRFKNPLLDMFEQEWQKVSGLAGGFTEASEEEVYKLRGQAMVKRVMDNPGPLRNKAVRLKEELPQGFLDAAEQFILCGKIDWLEYLEEEDALHIIDFKTGKNEEKYGSLQLPIYCLLVTLCQKRKVRKASYWYIDREKEPQEMLWQDPDDTRAKVLEIALEIKTARENNRLICSRNGCFCCRPLEEIYEGRAKFVGIGEYKRAIYI